MHPNDLLANGEWTLVQRGRRRRAPRDPHYPPPLMDSYAWVAPAPEARFHHLDNRHERLWAPRHPSPRRWEQHARPGRDWSPYGPARYHHHEGWSEAYRPAYSPTGLLASSPTGLLADRPTRLLAGRRRGLPIAAHLRRVGLLAALLGLRAPRQTPGDTATGGASTSAS